MLWKKPPTFHAGRGSNSEISRSRECYVVSLLEIPNYWELKRGTSEAPIIIRAAPGEDAVVFTRDINMANVSYFYLIGITIRPTGGGDAFHCERCDHLLIRGAVLDGGSTISGAHETLKVNQSQYVYLENNDIAYADDNNIDFVGVQYGHIIGNRVHDAADWCAYVKGGSAYIRIESNSFSNCGTGGFTAGQGSGFQFMTSPWTHYEAYDIKFVNNTITNTEGAAFGVNGGYNVLLAHNTAYRTGTRDHLVEVVFGERTCDGESDGGADSTCATYNAEGGWGPNRVRTTPEPIGNRNITIKNNILYNPSNLVAPTHFAIYGPRNPSGDVNIPSPQQSDDNLVIQGNVIWNGDEDTLVGIEGESEGCQLGNLYRRQLKLPGGPPEGQQELPVESAESDQLSTTRPGISFAGIITCTLAQILADNSINQFEPELQDPENGDYRPRESSNILSSTPSLLSAFNGGDRPSPPTSPMGILDNNIVRDFSGSEFSEPRVVGAFQSSVSNLNPPSVGGVALPNGSNGGTPPTFGSVKVSARRIGKRLRIKVTTVIQSTSSIASVKAALLKKGAEIASTDLHLTGEEQYGGSILAPKKGHTILIRISATNEAGTASTSKKSRVK